MMTLEDVVHRARPEFVEIVERGRIHFMGVGGAGMCALAELVLRGGGRVSGCDLHRGSTTDHLAEMGADIFGDHGTEHLEDVAGLVVSAAVPPDHPELVAARERGIPILKRAEALGQWVGQGRVIAIAGTHGKTSTTAIATSVFEAAGLEPTGFVGGRVPDWGGNLRYGSGELFVVEADEYDRSFLELTPYIAVVTNVEADHLDTYGDFDGVIEGFNAFLEGLPADGRAIVCGDDHGASRLLPRLRGRGYTYGVESGAQLRAVDRVPGPGGTKCTVVEDGEDRGVLHVPAHGVHNLQNALAAAAAARHMGVAWADIRRGIESFQGVSRRFEIIGRASGVVVVDDYAHHPTEVRATVAAARRAYPNRRVIVAFQPHLYSRTQQLAGDFGIALADADAVWITDVFPAREEPIPGVTGELVAKAVDALDRGVEVHYEPSLDALPDSLCAAAEPGDVIITAGAGSIERTGPELLRRLSPNADRGGADA
jgi:UDP-N-acetylmuramate--alanine ligase